MPLHDSASLSTEHECNEAISTSGIRSITQRGRGVVRAERDFRWKLDRGDIVIDRFGRVEETGI